MGVRQKLKFFSESHGIVSVILLTMTIAANSRIVNRSDFFGKRYSFNDSYQITPAFLKLLSFGYWTAVGDYLWLNAISELGYRKQTDENYKRAYEAFDLGTRLDPDFYEMYEQAGVAFAYFFEKPEASLEFLNRGIARYESGLAPPEFWSHPATLYVHAAYTYAYLMNNWEVARKMYLKAAEAPGAPYYLKQADVWIKEEGSERVLAARVLRALIRNTSDPLIKQRYEEKLKKYE